MKRSRIMIYFMNTTDTAVSYKLKMLVRNAVTATLEYEGVCGDAEVSVTFTDNTGIRALNKEFRNIDKETDVLSFPLTDSNGGTEPYDGAHALALGDVVVSLEKARAQAEEFGHSFEREVAFLCVHSMLHLLGYDHVESEEQDMAMRRRQREILKRMGLELN